MAITKTKLAQLENSVAAPGSIPATNTSNILTYITPGVASHLWGYELGTTATLPILIGTNLSYDAGSNTLNATTDGYSDVQEEGVGFTNSNTNTKLNFVGSGLTAADAGAGVTSITVAAFLNTLATAGAVNLTSHVTGTLPVANGGTGVVTITGLLQGNGTGAITGITNSSTVGQVLRVTGASTYAWGALDLADGDAITGNLPVANLNSGTSASASTFWRGDGTWAASTGATKTVGYVTGSGTDTYDLDAGVVVLDVDGAAFAFTVPTNLDLVDVYRNGVMLSRSGSTSRDYTLTSATGVLVLASVLATDETLKIVKRV